MQVVNLSHKQLKNFHYETLNTYNDAHLNYTKTKSINCSHNLLGSTGGFSSFQNLYNLDLSHNRITQAFQMPQSLVELNLSHNQLGSVFDEFQLSLKQQGTRMYVGSFLHNLKNLRFIDLSYNNISTINSNIFDGNTQLRKIIINNNLLSGSLWCFSKLEYLENIDISHNQLTLSDLKPLEKLRLQLINLRFNPLEQIDKCEDKILKLLLYTKKIELSYIQLEQSVILQSSKQSSKLDHSLTSNESMQQQTTDRTKRNSKFIRTKTPQKLQNRTPTKQQISITPRKQQKNMTPKQIKTVEYSQQQQQYKIEQIQKPTTKVPQLDLKLLKISPFPQSDIDSERDDFPMLFDEDDEKQLLEQLKQLGEIMKQKRQQQISLERQIAQNKYLLALMRVMIKGIYLYDVNEQNQEFDSMMNELHYRLEQDNLGDIKIRLMTFNKEHAQLNQMYQSLEQSERVVEQIKSQIN